MKGNGKGRRFSTLFLALIFVLALVLPAYASEGWFIGMNGGEFARFLLDGVSLVRVAVLDSKPMGGTDSKTGKFIWATYFPTQQLTVEIEEVIYGKKMKGKIICALKDARAVKTGTEMLLRLDLPNEAQRRQQIENMEPWGLNFSTLGLDFGPYDLGWAVQVEGDKICYPANGYMTSSEIDDIPSLKALLAGTLKPPYPAEHPNDQLCLEPSIYYYQLDLYSEVYDVYKVGYAIMKNIVVESETATVHELPDGETGAVYTAKRGDVLLDAGYFGEDEGEESPYPGWRRVLLAGEYRRSGYRHNEGYIREKHVSSGEPLPYGSYLVTMDRSIYLLDADGKVDRSHVLRKGTVQAVCARQDDGKTQEEATASWMLLTYRADRLKSRRYLSPKHANYSANDLPLESDIVSTDEAVKSGWKLDPLLMPPDWAAHDTAWLSTED